MGQSHLVGDQEDKCSNLIKTSLVLITNLSRRTF